MLDTTEKPNQLVYITIKVIKTVAIVSDLETCRRKISFKCFENL